eukprot:CAMPEP_0172499094 /NCGR_PEP_ID=MMETSP1066-20121228/121928_1 /TAXON_ID=671091 /ORGANISM="Coscinodiscus wailesii, Strain CCMP2513" /LENGTH=226 /DNA_ID=CAMNT_0013272651 /DNA_START=11 /DNA_END=691 /DNA_ORIENTATION=+
MTETIALFGGTGKAGGEFLALALEKGYKVKALARTPSKVTVKNDNLTLIEGDFSNEDAIKETVESAEYVVCMAGAKFGKPKEYPTDMMINFVKTLVPVLKSSSTVKTFLYQGGAWCAAPDAPLSYGTKFSRLVIGNWIVGIEPNLQDHDKVIDYVHSIQEEIQFKTIVTRPPGLNDGPGGKKLVATNNRGDTPNGITFKDLAVFTLAAIKDEALFGTYPLVAFEKN